MGATNKEKTIEAFKDLIVKYRNPVGKIFGKYTGCPLCAIHNVYGWGEQCKGCPLADELGEQGCNNFASFPTCPVDISNSDEDDYCTEQNKREYEKGFEARAKFFEKYLPVIKKCPESQFTEGGWVYFNFDLKD